VHLYRELASRRHDQCARRRRTGLRGERRRVFEPMEQREQECGCLSRSRLGLTRDVLAFECHRQSLALNRRALNEAGFSNSFLQSCRQWEVGEAEIGEMMALCGGFDIGPRYLQIRFSAVKNTVRPPIYPLYSCEPRGKHLPQIVPDPPGGVTFRLSATGYYRFSPIRPRGPRGRPRNLEDSAL